MSRPSGRGSEPPGATPQKDRPGWVTGLVATQLIALGMALALPLTPSKTGSTWSPAHLFSADPTYLEKVGASFVFVNLLLAVLGLAAWGISRWGKSA